MTDQAAKTISFTILLSIEGKPTFVHGQLNVLKV